jgi:hypothetical protein
MTSKPRSTMVGCHLFTLKIRMEKVYFHPCK